MYLKPKLFFFISFFKWSEERLEPESDSYCSSTWKAHRKNEPQKCTLLGFNFKVCNLKKNKVQKHTRRCEKRDVHQCFGCLRGPLSQDDRRHRACLFGLRKWSTGAPKYPWMFFFLHFLGCFCTFFNFKMETQKIAFLKFTCVVCWLFMCTVSPLGVPQVLGEKGMVLTGLELLPVPPLGRFSPSICPGYHCDQERK